MEGSDEMQEPMRYATSLLVGAIVRLRPLREDDLPLLERWWNDPGTMVLQQDRVAPRPTGAVADMFRSWSANKDDTGVGYSIESIHDDSLVGHVSLWGITARTRIAMLGIIIGAPHVSQGYGSDTVRVAVRLGFEELAAHKIELRTWAFNERARHVYAKAGFVEEGRRRAVLWHRGGFADEVLMGMLRAEYDARYRSA
jgi:RimJ/RimL family protein N-acetyltransferase